MSYRTASLLLVVVAVSAAMIYLGRIRPTPPERPRDRDAMYGYAAGLTWREGNNPYSYATFSRQRAVVGEDNVECNFAYAPTASLPAILASLMSPSDWKTALAAINVVAALAAGLCLALFGVRERARNDAMPAAPQADWCPSWLWPALLIVGSPISVANLHTGQTSIIAVSLALGALWMMRQGRDVLAGILLAVATFKVSIVAGVVVWCMMQGKVRVVIAGLLAGLVLAAPAILIVGFLETAVTWLKAIPEYLEFPQNLPTYLSSYGARAILARLDWPYQWTWTLALAFVVWTWLRRATMTDFEQFSVVLALPTLFVSAHSYDAVAIAPLALASILAASGRVALIVALVLAGCYLLPPSALQALKSIAIWRSVVGLSILAMVVVLVEARKIDRCP